MRTVICDWDVWHRTPHTALPHQPEYYELRSPIYGQHDQVIPAGAVVAAQREGTRRGPRKIKGGGQRIVDIDLVALTVISEE